VKKVGQLNSNIVNVLAKNNGIEYTIATTLTKYLVPLFQKWSWAFALTSLVPYYKSILP
jgi:hypothetical protein